MKQLFVIIFLVLVGLSIAAVAMEPKPNTGNKVNLVWSSDDNPARREQLALFNSLYPRDLATLDPGNLGMQKVIVQSLAGNGPDVFDSYGAEAVAAYAQAGVAWDITDALKRRGIDVTKTVWPLTQPTIVRNGRVYGTISNATATALWLNKDLFKKDGVPIPSGTWTWDQFLPVAQKLTHRDPSGRITQYGILLDWGGWQQFVYQWGGRLYTPDGARCIVDSPQAVAGIQFMQDLTYKYHVAPSPSEEDAMATAGGWGSGTLTLFESGSAAMAEGGRYWLCTMRTDPAIHLGAVSCPYPRGGRRVYLGGGRGTLINAKSPRREQALDFLLYLQSRQYTELINHQADGLGPVVRYCQTEKFLHDPAYPEEDYNAVWRDAIQHGVQTEMSPYINPQAAETIFNMQLDLIKSNQKPVAAALHDAAEQINEAIKANIAKDAKLRAQYLKATGGAA